MAIIGTAGHIDHGKSAVIQTLTSIDPDRLPEEKRRGMTIDLGFAWLPLSSGEIVGFIDVPGHEDLVRNMIAGVTGIDAALLVIAADDGWMPQTEEHLQILDLLNVRRGIVALTKIDLIDDPGWLDVLEEDIRERLKGTVLAGAPIVRVSALEGTNFVELRREIEHLVAKVTPRDTGKPRLSIDRVFMIKGSGLVLTGTLMGGSLRRGTEVHLFPGNVSSRIRGLESYKTNREKVLPGNRVAINLVGLEKKDLKRGDMLFGGKEQYVSSRTMDAEVRLIREVTVPLKSNTKCAVYMGTREAFSNVVLLGRQSLKAGEESLAQFRFEEEVAARVGDHFVLRRVSPPETIGGGRFLDPIARRHKFRDLPKVSAVLDLRRSLRIEDLVISELDKENYIEEKRLVAISHFSVDEIRECLGALEAAGKLIMVNTWIIGIAYWKRQCSVVLELLKKDHEARPLEKGLSQAEVQSRLRLPKIPFGHLIAHLCDRGMVYRNGDVLALSTHRPSLSSEQEILVSKMLRFFEVNRSNPPTRKEVIARLGGDTVLRYMCRRNLLVELPEGILFERNHYESVKSQIVDLLKKKSFITFQEARDVLGFSRKYLFPLFVKLQEEGVVLQQGDRTVLRG